MPAQGRGGAELGRSRGPDCHILAPLPWARSGLDHSRFEHKGLGVETVGAPGERGGSSRVEAASGRERTRVCQGPDTGSPATAGRCCLCCRRGAAVGRASSSQSQNVPEASKPAEQTARLGGAALGAEGDMAAHWMPAASLQGHPRLAGHRCCLTGSALARTTRVPGQAPVPPSPSPLPPQPSRMKNANLRFTHDCEPHQKGNFRGDRWHGGQASAGRQARGLQRREAVPFMPSASCRPRQHPRALPALWPGGLAPPVPAVRAHVRLVRFRNKCGI